VHGSAGCRAKIGPARPSSLQPHMMTSLEGRGRPIPACAASAWKENES